MIWGRDWGWWRWWRLAIHHVTNRVITLTFQRRGEVPFTGSAVIRANGGQIKLYLPDLVIIDREPPREGMAISRDFRGGVGPPNHCQTQDARAMLIWCRACVCDAGPAPNQHCVSVWVSTSRQPTIDCSLIKSGVRRRTARVGEVWSITVWGCGCLPPWCQMYGMLNAAAEPTAEILSDQASEHCHCGWAA